jgi:hypothetical protein
MKSIYLLLAAVLLMMATVWARAAAQGIEQALVSIGVEWCLKVLRAGTRAVPNTISSVWMHKNLPASFEDKISDK